MLVGYLFFPIFLIMNLAMPIWIPVAMAIPLLIDGFTQRWKWRKSSNTLRFFTGIVFGVGQSMFISTAILTLVEWVG